jgi:hypothetical protein
MKSNFEILANTSTGISAEFTTSARNSLTLTLDSRPDLVWCFSKFEKTRVNVP